MLIEYFNNVELAYANRKRYRTFSFTPFAIETQYSVLLGDGAETTIKTSKDNICNYVRIDGTRWYVTSWVYMNGGQVTLFLQRDVVGEFGLNGCFGKIERGYTDTFLKYRKELSLNEILKERKTLIPNTFEYGNYTVNTHKNELWGVMYFVKPTGNDPSTGQPYSEKVNINIPAFAPQYVDYPLIDNGSQFISNVSSGVRVRFFLEYAANNDTYSTFMVTITFLYNNDWVPEVVVEEVSSSVWKNVNFYVNVNSDIVDISIRKQIIFNLFTNIAQDMIYGNLSSSGLSFPPVPSGTVEKINYTGVIVKNNNKFYKYTSTRQRGSSTGNTDKINFCDYITTFSDSSVAIDINGTQTNIIIEDLGSDTSIESMNNLDISSQLNYYIKTYSREEVPSDVAGDIVINTVQQLIDEPYSVLVFPLFDCIITGEEGTFNVVRTTAFNIFNTVIQYLSGGSNPYLIDAQIYPYCPVLTSVGSKLQGYPFFQIQSNTYIHTCDIQLLPNIDIKKDYIERLYSIVSPEKTGRFDFNFYDYINNIVEINGRNEEIMQVVVKTALKPFAIISSAVIQPTLNSLKGITYDSDLRGAQPSSNGFECSLASNAFETYRRQNSNYQQIFALQKEELALTHATEKVNETTSAVVNTLTATTMGAIGGASLAGGGKTGIIGAVAGGAAAGASVGIAMGVQMSQNEKLREFEKRQQQENFDFSIGTIKNLPNSINRISTFNEIILQDFWFVIEIYECSDEEKELVDSFIRNYGYGIGVFSFLSNFYKNGWFLRSTLVTSNFPPNLHLIAENEFMRGVYIYDKV